MEANSANLLRWEHLMNLLNTAPKEEEPYIIEIIDKCNLDYQTLLKGKHADC